MKQHDEIQIEGHWMHALQQALNGNPAPGERLLAMRALSQEATFGKVQTFEHSLPTGRTSEEVVVSLQNNEGIGRYVTVSHVSVSGVHPEVRVQVHDGARRTLARTTAGSLSGACLNHPATFDRIALTFESPSGVWAPDPMKCPTPRVPILIEVWTFS